jgi:tRNA threonylcarbamoyladenosine biosynthesis protein TsaE
VVIAGTIVEDQIDKDWYVIIQRTTNDPQDTEVLAEEIGRSLRGGEVIELVSDLGGGKTTFVRGLAKGAGSVVSVSSPSFTISHEYTTKKFVIHHFDFYRLHNPGIMTHELAELLKDPRAVIVIEWAKVVSDILPKEHIRVAFRATHELVREISIQCPSSQEYLLNAVKLAS